MQQNEENAENITGLVSSIKNIYIDSNDLLAISIEFSKIYFNRKMKAEEDFDKFWASPALIDLMTLATQESISLSLSSITLKESIDFGNLIELIIDSTAQDFYINELSVDEVEKLLVRKFIFALRREIFSRVFVQNKAFIEVSEISKEVIEDRKDLFMEMNSDD